MNADAVLARRRALPELVRRFTAAGFSAITHAVGDGAVRGALDAYEAAGPPRRGKHRVEHIETLTDEDLPRFAGLDVAASMQPLHMEGIDEPTCPPGSTASRRGATSAASGRGDLPASGAVLPLGSDWMVADYDPRVGMAWARCGASRAGPTTCRTCPSRRSTARRRCAATPPPPPPWPATRPPTGACGPGCAPTSPCSAPIRSRRAGRAPGGPGRAHGRRRRDRVTAARGLAAATARGTQSAAEVMEHTSGGSPRSPGINAIVTLDAEGAGAARAATRRSPAATCSGRCTACRSPSRTSRTRPGCARPSARRSSPTTFPTPTHARRAAAAAGAVMIGKTNTPEFAPARRPSTACSARP